jgi:hypothetical protein
MAENVDTTVRVTDHDGQDMGSSKNVTRPGESSAGSNRSVRSTVGRSVGVGAVAQCLLALCIQAQVGGLLWRKRRKVSHMSDTPRKSCHFHVATP